MKNVRFSFSCCLTLFLCIVLFAAVLPTAALAAGGPVMKIDVTVPTTPVAGAAATTEASVSAGVFVYSAYWWRDDNGDGEADAYFDDTFKAEGDYYLRVVLRPEYGYSVPLTATGDAEIPYVYQGQLYVNGEYVSIVPADAYGTLQVDWWGKPAKACGSINVSYNHQGVRADVGEVLTLKVKTDLPTGQVSGTASYQWYKAGSNYYGTGAAIPGATNSSYKIPTDMTGMCFYYCVVTAKLKNGTTVSSVNSDSPIIWVNVQNIGEGFDAYNDGEPDTYIVYSSEEDFTFDLGQRNDENKTVTYQWYECDADGFPIHEELNNGRSFLIYGIPENKMMQPIYYKCVASADGNKTWIEKDEVLFSAVLYPKGVASANPFSDVPEDAYYSAAVAWAVDMGITSGVSDTKFDPNGACTRAQAVTFLWRAAGSPVPSAAALPFADLQYGSYYYNAVMWAVENDVTSGTSTATFSPNSKCSRAQIVTFLWRFAGSPEVDSMYTGFGDVSHSVYYADAVIWAAENGITSGTSANTFSPNNTCTRAQIVTFLYRAISK